MRLIGNGACIALFMVSLAVALRSESRRWCVVWFMSAALAYVAIAVIGV